MKAIVELELPDDFVKGDCGKCDLSQSTDFDDWCSATGDEIISWSNPLLQKCPLKMGELHQYGLTVGLMNSHDEAIKEGIDYAKTKMAGDLRDKVNARVVSKTEGGGAIIKADIWIFDREND